MRTSIRRWVRQALILALLAPSLTLWTMAGPQYAAAQAPSSGVVCTTDTSQHHGRERRQRHLQLRR